MLLLSLSTVVAFLMGYLFLSYLWPTGSGRGWLPIVAALPAGWSLTSVFYFLWTLLSGGSSGWYPAVELAILAVAGAYLFCRRGFRPELPRFRWRQPLFVSLMTASLVAAGGICLVIPLKLSSINPWGYWDAWARINLKARFLYGGGENWEWIFQGTQVPHHDYPLLLACSVARCWAWMGEAALPAPQMLSLVWGGIALVLLFAVTTWLRPAVSAVTVSLAYLTFTPALFWWSAQYSDIPLACYMLLACAMMVAAGETAAPSSRFAVLTGFFAASAAWAKNEGIAFLFLAFFCWLLISLRREAGERLGSIFSFLKGAAIPLAAVAFIKTAFAGATDILTEPSSASLPALIADLERHKLIWGYLAALLDSFWRGWPLLLLGFAFVLQHLGKRCRIATGWPLLCVAGMTGIYYLVFLTTPHDLHWHFHTTIDRLILQLWPLSLFGIAVLIREASGDASEGEPKEYGSVHDAA